MNDFWFAVYHLYSTSHEYDKKGLTKFKMDAEFAARQGVKYVILEDYYDRLTWGEYSNLWNEKNFRKMIEIVNDNGMKLIPYIDITELATKGEIYKKKGKTWGAKNRWGKVYSGFISIFLPIAYPYVEYDFATKIMCPKSGWREYLVGQAAYLLNNFEIDGIYMDRIDYRLKCHDHFPDEDHFKTGIFDLVLEIVNTVRAFGDKYISIVNDSCMYPDAIMTKCIESVDFVLSELLPADWNPNALPNRTLNELGDLIWKLRRFLKPILTTITEWQFSSETMIDLQRINNIINRLKKIKKVENIILFSHRKDLEGFKAIKKISEMTNAKIAFFSGFKPLVSLNDAL
ncbi:MAG: DUF6259 domain-containing protein [Candidatus Helarchaeota archaeon]